MFRAKGLAVFGANVKCRFEFDFVPRSITQFIQKFTKCSGAIALGHSCRKKVPVQYHDSATWETHSTASELKLLIEEHLIRPDDAPNYEALHQLRKLGDTESIQCLLNTYVKLPTETMIATVKYMEDLMKLVTDDAIERSHSARSTLKSTLEMMNRGLSPDLGCGERNIVTCDTTHSGNARQYAKHFLTTKSDAITAGRVIICSGDTPEQKRIIEQMLKASTANELAELLCELIRLHVERVCGRPQDPLNYCDPQTAYATWVRTTSSTVPGDKRDAKPLLTLILDGVCEELAQRLHPSLVHKSSGLPYTLLEALCLAIPSPYSVVVIGRNAHVDATDPTFLSQANVTNVVLPAATKLRSELVGDVDPFAA